MLEGPFSTKFFPIVVAHRGASEDAPENTLEAFDLALSAGAGAVESDLRLTADGVPVVLHDADLSRISDGAESARVAELSLSRLQGLGLGIPTLAEVLALVEGRGAVDLEIKNVPWDPDFEPDAERVLEASIDEVRRHSMEDSVLVSSFHLPTLARSREVAPAIPTGLLTPPTVAAAEALGLAIAAQHAFVLPNAAALIAAGPEIVDRAHEAAVFVGTWVVDDGDTIAQMMNWGVDAVATNDPAAGVAARHRFLGAD